MSGVSSRLMSVRVWALVAQIFAANQIGAFFDMWAAWADRRLQRLIERRSGELTENTLRQPDWPRRYGRGKL